MAGALPVVAVACRNGENGEPRSTPAGDDPAGATATSPDAGPLPPTPACGDGPTPPQTEGPFFSAGTPERSSLREDGMEGTPLVVEGAVVSVDCDPVPGSRMEFWQTDDAGEYDNEGHRLRGHLFADELGRFRVETIVPGIYTGRTRHIHVKVQPEGTDPLTTQLYFPDEPGNDRDGIFDPQLLMTMGDDTDGTRLGTYTFVVEPA